MSVIETVRHRVALAGQVIDTVTGKMIAEADVAMTSMPPSFQKRLNVYRSQFGAEWDARMERPDRTRSRADGQFYFLDLPDGIYGLRASVRIFGSRYGAMEQKVTVSRNAKGTYKLEWSVLGLSPTAVKGTISSRKTSVSFARVRVQGSGETAFTDADGRYLIAGIEPGKRTLLVYAQGYRTISQRVSIAAPGDAQTVNFNLLRDAG
jgi:hypothetical protein